jgi:hypothetical protein
VSENVAESEGRSLTGIDAGVTDTACNRCPREVASATQELEPVPLELRLACGPGKQRLSLRHEATNRFV